MNYSDEFYRQLKKPSFQPPAWVFILVWSVLYLLMLLSFLLIIKSGGYILPATILFFLQLALNFSWSPIFFKYHKIKLGFYIIIWLIITVLGMIIAFFRLSFWAGVLLLPYLLWLFVALALNYKIMKLNNY